MRKLSSFLIISSSICVFNVFLVTFPNEAIGAAKDGLLLFVNNVMPALFPFIIATNILISTGIARWLGGLFEPLMRIFNVPGAGGLAFFMGALSGYPMGAKVCAQLYDEGLLDTKQVQRLLSFCNNSGPLFIIGAVGVTMFGNVKSGYFILLVHLLSACVNGLLFRNLGSTEPLPPIKRISRPRLTKDIGTAVSESVSSACESILRIGAYIMLFCVITKGFEVFLSLPDNANTAIFSGFLEITNGIERLSSLGNEKFRYLATLSIISFGGLSIHAQSLGFLTKTGIKKAWYFATKLTHAAIALGLGFLIYPLFFKVS